MKQMFFWNSLAFFYDPADVGSEISGSSAFCKSSLYIWKFSVQVLSNAGDVRDVGSISVLGRFPGVGNGNLLQYSCLEESMGRGARQVTAHRGSQRVRHDWAVEHRECIAMSYLLSFISVVSARSQTQCGLAKKWTERFQAWLDLGLK